MGTKISALSQIEALQGKDVFPFVQNSSGNTKKVPASSLAFHAATTATATAGQWSNIATLSLGSLDNADIVTTLLLTAGSGTDLTTATLELIAKQTTAISSTETKARFLHISDATAISATNVMLVAAATTKGTAIYVWVKSNTAVKWQVTELSRHVNSDATTPISYNDASTWTASNPSGTVAVTSDWATNSYYTPVASFGGASTGITYSTQIGETYERDGMVYDYFNIQFSNNGSASGDLAVSLSNTIGVSTVAQGIVRLTNMSSSLTDLYLNGVAGNTVVAVNKNNGGVGVAVSVQDTDTTNTTRIVGFVVYPKG